MNFSDMHFIPVTIGAGQTESAEFDTNGRGIAAILIVSGWTAAAITLRTQVAEGGTYYPVYLEDATEVGIAQANVAADRLIYLPPDAAGVGFPYKAKIRSGTNGSAQAQASARTIYVLLRGY